MQVGFIGLGTMGASFATNIQKAGYDLIVHDIARQAAQRHIDAGAKWADSPRALAEQCDVVLTSLPGPPEVRAVATDADTGMLAGMKPGSVFYDLSTNSPAVVREIHAEFAAQGVHMLDAPVSGGPKGAASGKLAIWVGGDEEVFNANRAPLDAMGDAVRYIGAIGAGSVAKLVHNSAGYAIQSAIGEIFAVGVKAGVDPLALFEAIRMGARGRTRTFDSLADHYMINSYDPADFALKLAHKDVSLAAEMARDVGVPARMIDLTRAEMTEALNRGWGHRDSRSFMLLQQERADILIDEDESAVEDVLNSDKK
ncbi:MAG: NAD(P)-dependent oxidoreductase [Alphaproteobacteria bacterium]|jgi:3-hydroxyisobutyrate dehydrogenase-like beta-hydroxyacid dehydrogenase|nr:NAD(P)-dependent oxidoreductase [Alphaproteobacteria bacterium]